jgi:ribosomal protein L4
VAVLGPPRGALGGRLGSRPGTLALLRHRRLRCCSLGTARAARNIDRVYLQEAAKLNPVDLAKYKKIIVSTKALETIIARINGGKN